MSRFVYSLVFLVAPLLAQAPSASVVGRVVDASGAVVPGVAVKITNLDTNQTYRGVEQRIGRLYGSVSDSGTVLAGSCGRRVPRL